jgi:phage shock protein E
MLRTYTKCNKNSSNNDELVIDVRTKTEWDINHLPNAIHIPYNKIDKLNINKNKIIRLCCTTGRRANIAKESLRDLGYTNLTVFKCP